VLLGPSRDLLAFALVPWSTAFLAFFVLLRRHPAFLDDPRVLLGGAVLLRLTLFPSLPDLSDDLYRYVWDGWLTASGLNPYLHPPSAPVLSDFQESPLFGLLNSPDFHSVYPPLSQIVFLLGGLTYSIVGWPAAAYAVKVGFLILELAGVAAMFLALRRMGIRPGALALYAWNPLVLLTLAGGGHTEGGLVAGLGLLAWGVASGGRRRAWLGLVLAVSSKGIPLVMAPLLLRHQLGDADVGTVARSAVPALLFGVALALAFGLPGALPAVAGSVDLYVRHFEFNAGLYMGLQGVGRMVTGSDIGYLLGPALRWTWLASALAITLLWPLGRVEAWFRGAILLMGLYLIAATTVHPWYLIWGLAFIPFTTFTRGAWLWASWAAFLTYFTYVGVSHGVVTAAFWGGTSILLLKEFEHSIRNRLLRVAGWRKARQLNEHVGGGTVLDLGAGEGYVADALVRNRRTGTPARRLILADVGPWFRSPLPAFVYDGSNLPLPDDSVGTIVISLALHHAENPDRVLAEALRVARERVVVTESTYRWEWELRLLEVVDRFANRTRNLAPHGGEEHLAFRTVRGWEETFRSLGARLVRSERLNRVGHRHHLFVLEPGATLTTPNRGED